MLSDCWFDKVLHSLHKNQQNMVPFRVFAFDQFVVSIAYVYTVLG